MNFTLYDSVEKLCYFLPPHIHESKVFPFHHIHSKYLIGTAGGKEYHFLSSGL